MMNKSLVRIPNSRYIVFYSGLEHKMESYMQQLRLSDSFEETDNSVEFEWTATMMNINAGHNAVDDCIRDGILKEFLEMEKKEGISVVLTEFDEEKFEAMIREEGREEGKLLQLCELVSKMIVKLETALEESHLSDADFLKIMERFGLPIE